MRALILFISTLIFSFTTYAGEGYRWLDEKGVIHLNFNVLPDPEVKEYEVFYVGNCFYHSIEKYEPQPVHKDTREKKKEKKKLTREQRRMKKAWREFKKAEKDYVEAQLKGKNYATVNALRKKMFKKLNKYSNWAVLSSK